MKVSPIHMLCNFLDSGTKRELMPVCLYTFRNPTHFTEPGKERDKQEPHQLKNEQCFNLFGSNMNKNEDNVKMLATRSSFFIYLLYIFYIAPNFTSIRKKTL